MTDTGATSGSAGAYIPCLDVSALGDSSYYNRSTPSAGVDVQLISIMCYIANSETDPKTLTVPSNALYNGAGKNSALNTRIPPDIRAYNVGPATSAWLSTTQDYV